MADMYEKIDVLNAVVFPSGAKVQDETSITPDSEDVHEFKDMEFVTQRVSEVPRFREKSLRDSETPRFREKPRKVKSRKTFRAPRKFVDRI